ncbi:MAG: gliding motility-associated ABC transporter substrate-binding protein GldG [Saprospiraceae bacterium]
MVAIFKKEIQAIFGSYSLMLAVAVYFILVGLWLWFFPDTSIPDNKFATLQTLFNIAPWLFLFIIPALTMKSISEEKATGTLDVLKSKPITMASIVFGKFASIIVLVFFILLLSQFYTFSVYELGLPKGNLDIGGTMGSFLAWLLLAACFTAIGIFASSISTQQTLAFLLGAVLSFLWYAGPSFVATLPVLTGGPDYFIQWIGMQSHYQSLSRGVIDSGDVCYFIGMTYLFLFAATKSIQWNGSFKNRESMQAFFKMKEIWIILGLLAASGFKLFTIDLTGDRRYTLSNETKSLIKNVDDVIYVTILMDGKFPAAFRRLQKSALEKLADFNHINKNIVYNLEDPLAGPPDQVKANQEGLRKDGISPTRLTIFNGKEQEQKIVYPFAVFHFGERAIPVNLLESSDPSISEDEVLNRSVSLLEYKFGNAIQKLRMDKNPVVVFTKGHGELTSLQTADLERTLRPVYSTGRITLDSVPAISKEIDILIVAKPQSMFSTRDNFLIDQYLMNGGKIIWLIDPLYVNTDTVNASNRIKQDFIPLPYNLNLDELFFKYGWRIAPDIILDYACSTIPLLAGFSGSSPQFEPKPWYYHPLLTPVGDHPIVKNLDRISSYYPASVDTIKTKTSIIKTLLLSSSDHSRTQMSPSPINFEIVRQDLKPEQFNRKNLPVGWLMEGSFSSAFENRLSTEFSQSLTQIGASYKAQGVPTKMIVYGDGDLIANAVNNRGEPSPLGFNIYEQRIYSGNKNLILNSIEYLLDEHQMMNARNKEVRLRLLDKAELVTSKSFWQWLNLLLPAILTFIVAWIFQIRRKRYYGQLV